MQLHYDGNQYDCAVHWIQFHYLKGNKYDVLFAEYSVTKPTTMLLWNRELRSYAFCFKHFFTLFSLTAYGNFVQTTPFNDAEIFTIIYLSNAPDRKVLVHAMKDYDNNSCEQQFKFGVKRFGNFAMKLKQLFGSMPTNRQETILRGLNQSVIDAL